MKLKKMKKTHLLLLTIFLFTMFSCSESNTENSHNTEVSTEKKALHVGEWNVVKMNMAGEDVLPSTIGNPIYSFNADHSYVLLVSGQKEIGHWTMEGDVLVLKSDEYDKVSKLKILEVSENKMKYEIGDEFITIVSLEK